MLALVVVGVLATPVGKDGGAGDFPGEVMGLPAVENDELRAVRDLMATFDPAAARGLACGWAQEDRAVLVMDTTTTDAASAATHAAQVHDAFSS